MNNTGVTFAIVTIGMVAATAANYFMDFRLTPSIAVLAGGSIGVVIDRVIQKGIEAILKMFSDVFVYVIIASIGVALFGFFWSRGQIPSECLEWIQN